MKPNQKRMNLLIKVINSEENFLEAMAELREYDWDFNETPAIIQRSAFKNILLLYIEGKLSAEKIYEWANFLELREDVDFLEKDEPLLSEILHELANPDLEGDLTSTRAKAIIAKL